MARTTTDLARRLQAIINSGECTIRHISTDSSVHGVTAMDEYEHANVYINDKLSFEQQQKALLHELTHIANRDFDREL